MSIQQFLKQEGPPPPWPHQIATRATMLNQWGAADGVMNLSDCGTGKTRATLMFLLALFEAKELPPVVVFGTLSSLESAWKDDIARYTPELSAVAAYAKNRATAFTSKVNLTITNHDAVKWLADQRALLEEYRKAGAILIVDEQTAFKNYNSQRSKAFLYVASFFRMVVPMSATPTPRTVMNIFAPLVACDTQERVPKNYYKFRHMFCNPEQFMAQGKIMQRWVDKEFAFDMLTDMMGDLVIRYSDALLNLPENRRVYRYVTLPPKVKQAYDDMVASGLMVNEDGSPVNAINAGVKARKLLQLCTGAVFDQEGNVVRFHDERYALAIDLAKEVDHSLIGYNWSHELTALRDHAKRAGLTFTEINGSVTGERRVQAMRDYQEGKYDTIFVHPTAGSHAITLTKARRTIWASLCDDPERFIQFNKRVHRGGQDKLTDTIVICAKDTKEDEVAERISMRSATQAEVLAMFADLTKIRDSSNKKT